MKAPIFNHPLPVAHSIQTQTLKVQKVSLHEMEECRKKEICYYCDEK
jgi:hypothetical protein